MTFFKIWDADITKPPDAKGKYRGIWQGQDAPEAIVAFLRSLGATKRQAHVKVGPTCKLMADIVKANKEHNPGWREIVRKNMRPIRKLSVDWRWRMEVGLGQWGWMTEKIEELEKVKP
jgi:hypothetical protein